MVYIFVVNFVHLFVFLDRLITAVQTFCSSYFRCSKEVWPIVQAMSCFCLLWTNLFYELPNMNHFNEWHSREILKKGRNFFLCFCELLMDLIRIFFLIYSGNSLLSPPNYIWTYSSNSFLQSDNPCISLVWFTLVICS